MRRLSILLFLALILSACFPTKSAMPLRADASATLPVPASTATVATKPPAVPLAAGEQAAPLPKAEAIPIPPTGSELAFPIRAAFYYPWFPEAWKQQGMDPFTHYQPSLGFYSQDDLSVIRQQVEAMQYGKIQAGIASWWGKGDQTDLRMPALLQVGVEKNFPWAVYYEAEGQKDPTPAEIQADLTYIRDTYATSPAYLHIGGRFVVFVYADGQDGCNMSMRWKQANTVGAYVVLKVFAGYRACADQPDGWHQYAPAVATDQQDTYSYAISPGFWKANESSPRLARDLARWQANIQSMIASGADFQLVTTFNEWGEGTSVESASEWASPSGYGLYLDALHYDGVPPANPETFKDHLPLVQREETGGPLLAGAGDIGECKHGAGITGGLLAGLPPDTTIFTAGDDAYPDGTLGNFTDCYDPSWGPFKDRTYPAAGNHEYHTPGAAGYYDYFGAAAGERDKGYYSFNLGTWHIVVLNSNCDEVGGCDAGSPQETWLQADLAANPTQCTLGIWHHPLFSSGEHGNNSKVKELWQALYDGGADVVINGHDHHYERFAPQDASGHLDTTRGLREFIVGTGGGRLYNVDSQRKPNSEFAIQGSYGVIELALQEKGYIWWFRTADGVADQGVGVCH